MPTGRFWAFLVVAFVFWFFANQTQIGWLYIISALLGGVLIAAFILNRNTLRQFSAGRLLNMDAGETSHEGDIVKITTTMRNTGSLPATHLTITEHCVLAAPDSEQASIPLFVPMLRKSLQFDYETTIHRRGLHHFEPLDTASRAPFGFFARKRPYPIETSLLVYPEVRKLSRLSLLDEQPAAELTNPKAGIGSEVIGVRPYRAGDSPRHIHWRSVARRGQLVSKEFAQETQPGVSLVLDRYLPLSPVPETKHQPFEITIKCAVSIAEYAMRKGYPVHLAVDQTDFAAPQGAIIWDALMQYTARVMPLPEPTLSDVLSYQSLQQFVAIVLSWVDGSLLETLLSLRHKGYKLLVIVPDPASFPVDSEVTATVLAGALERNGIDYRIIKHGQDWAEIISEEFVQFTVERP